MEPAGWFPARSRAGIQAFSRESPDAKSRGGGPPPPHFYGPLVGTRSFWRWKRSRTIVGLVRHPSTCPDLETFFFEIFSDWIFPQSNVQLKLFLRICVSKSGLVHMSQKETVAFSTDAKDGASPSERFDSRGCRGEPPAILSPCFLIKKAGPPPGRRAPGALRPEAGPEAGPTGSVPTGAGPRPNVAGLRLRWSYRDHLPIPGPAPPGAATPPPG